MMASNRDCETVGRDCSSHGAHTVVVDRNLSFNALFSPPRIRKKLNEQEEEDYDLFFHVVEGKITGRLRIYNILLLERN